MSLLGTIIASLNARAAGAIMSDIQPFQILILLMFLGVLLTAQFIIKRLVAHGKVVPFQSEIQIGETLRVSPKERLHLVTVKGQSFLLFISKTGASSIQQINTLGEGHDDA